MRANLINIIFILCFFYPIVKGFIFKFSTQNIKKDVEEVIYNITFLISFFLSMFFAKKIFIEHDSGIYKLIYSKIPDTVIKLFGTNFILIYAVMIPVFLAIIFKILTFFESFLLKIIVYPILKSIEDTIKRKRSFTKRVFGSISQIPRAVCYVLLVAFVLNILSLFNIENNFGVYLEKSIIYRSICQNVIIPMTNSKLARQLPNILDNSFKVQQKELPNQADANSSSGKRVIIYYNGMTLDEAVKSNAEIDSFAVKLASGENSKVNKAQILYNWIGKNISYDEDKAKQILNDDFEQKSGAVPTFKTRKGICFDYACLYTAMCKANGIKVRIVTGQGFNGVSWVSHAWNQIYIPEEKKWINVDTTFSKGGNYFNSLRFDMDHREASIAGEW
ncbi:MAG: transglutaminase-like domain-containing protein [Bacillota bacterium]|nr:transglutaminase-like domain-containing protein [Bacillota bacterium]